MIVYESERQDGLSNVIKAQSRVTYASQASPSAPFPVANLPRAVASRGDFDLFYLKTILATVGWNLNDDYFDAAETWKARHTPEDKPFNYEHNSTDIIGHITSSWVVGADGAVVQDDDTLPAKFHVATGAVLYRAWADKTAQERMDKVIAEIGEGKWFVSMEALFPTFDYIVNGRVIARNEQTAYLTKHLRAYGGDGTYEGYRVGRVLRDFTFSGKGLVRKPANPESIIVQNEKVIACLNVQEDAIAKVSADVLKYFTDEESVIVANETEKPIYTQRQLDGALGAVALLAQSKAEQAQAAPPEHATAADGGAGKVQADIVRYMVGDAGEPEHAQALAYEPYGDYLSVTQVGVLTSLGADFIREAIKDKELPASIGTAEKPLYRVARKDVDEFMAKRKLAKKKQRGAAALTGEEREAATAKTQADVLAYFCKLEDTGCE